jgi:UDP:flavonoid glycosyltransferase YjiC (YdhE family)
MKRFGIFCFLGRGHLDPAIAIGRALQGRGHRVTIFHLSIAESAIRRSSLGFAAIDLYDPPARARSTFGENNSRSATTVRAITEHAIRTIREGCAAVRAQRVDAIIADQLDAAAGTIAESVDLPHVTLSCSPPIYLDNSIPPPYFGWGPTADSGGQERNGRANTILERAAQPLIGLINRQRVEWGLREIQSINQLFSKQAIITQLPYSLEFPRIRPAHLHYTGQFRDDALDAGIPFDWAGVSKEPFIYASLGTVRNTSKEIFRAIACACACVGMQLILSLGGGRLLPSDIEPLPGKTIVCHYVPQRALLKRAALAINCAGLNTTLECLRNGVPLVTIPIGEDQPGVAARVVNAKVGVAIPPSKLTRSGLEQAIRQVFDDDDIRASAAFFKQKLSEIDGVQTAADIIERFV